MAAKAQPDSSAPARAQVLVWDLPTRVFHWLLLGCFSGALALAETAFLLHVILGLIVAFAAVLRILWGLLGSPYARFSAFSLRPKALVAYFQGLFGRTESTSVGHNPATSYVTVVMLLSSLGLTVTGVIMSRGGEAKEAHEVFAGAFVVSAALHVLGLFWHAWRHRDGIALGMFHGKKVGAPAAGLKSSHPAAAVAFVVLVGTFSGLLAAGYDTRTEQLTLLGTGWTIKGETHKRKHGRGHGESQQRRHDDSEHESGSTDHERHDDDDDDDD